MHGSLHHLELYVSNLAKSSIFWKWLLTEEFSYSIYQEWDKGISFKYQNTYIVFVQTEEKYLDKQYHRKNTGLNHLAFHAESRAFVEALSQKLIALNIPVLYADKHPFAGGKDYYAVFFEDPDRIKVEVVSAS